MVSRWFENFLIDPSSYENPVGGMVGCGDVVGTIRLYYVSGYMVQDLSTFGYILEDYYFVDGVGRGGHVDESGVLVRA